MNVLPFFPSLDDTPRKRGMNTLHINIYNFYIAFIMYGGVKGPDEKKN